MLASPTAAGLKSPSAPGRAARPRLAHHNGHRAHTTHNPVVRIDAFFLSLDRCRAQDFLLVIHTNPISVPANKGNSLSS